MDLEKDYRKRCLEGGNPGYMSHIGMIIRTHLKSGKVIFPEDEGVAHNSFKDVIGKSLSSTLPFQFKSSARNLANVELLRLAFHAYPVVVRKQNFDYRLSREQYLMLSKDVVFTDKTEDFEINLVQYPNSGDEYFVYFYTDSKLFLVPANLKHT
ncbi:hypothetical protein MJD09_21520, partial [bacterium]|nr:hypothetical protein [bacterium]